MTRPPEGGGAPGQGPPCRRLPDGRILLDYGPMTLSISAQRDGAPAAEAAARGAERAVAAFHELLPFLPLARSYLPALEGTDPAAVPDVLRRMLAAVRLLEDPAFTPMAAVAGSFADVIREEVLSGGQADAAVVNNGGDVSYSAARPARPFRAGIISDLSVRRITHCLSIPPDQGTHGIATSGFGGRSLTRGIASAVTVIARTCALADAAATDVANHAFAEDPLVRTCPAGELDPGSDIAELTVVRAVGPLSRAAARAALEGGFARARELYGRGVIQGAVLFVGGCFTFYPPGLDLTEVPGQPGTRGEIP